jgi:hypothetical protein
MKISVPIAMIFIGLCLTFGFTYQRSKNSLNIKLDVKDLPEEGIILMGPSDPAFDAEEASLIGANTSSLAQYIDAAKPFCVFIKNTDSREIAGYRLKWELLEDDGKTTTSWSSSSAPGLLSGDKLTSGNTVVDGSLPIRPGAMLFVSRDSAMADLLYSSKSNQANQTEDFLEKRNAIMSNLGAISREKSRLVVGITVSVDCVYFVDGTFVGPDTGNLLAETQGYLDAQSDLGQLIRQHVQQQRSSSELFGSIKSIADEPDTVIGSNPTVADYKSFLIKIQARNLLKIREKGGDAGAIEHMLKSLNTTRAKLQRKTVKN